MLTRFVERNADRLDDADLDHLERLLETQDPQLYAWLTGAGVPEDRALAALVEQIRAAAAEPPSG